MVKLTLADARATVRALGFTLRHDAYTGEHELRRVGARTDAESYFTDDRQDAVDTAQAIHRRAGAID